MSPSRIFKIRIIFGDFGGLLTGHSNWFGRHFTCSSRNETHDFSGSTLPIYLTVLELFIFGTSHILKFNVNFLLFLKQFKTVKKSGIQIFFFQAVAILEIFFQTFPQFQFFETLAVNILIFKFVTFFIFFFLYFCNAKK